MDITTETHSERLNTTWITTRFPTEKPLSQSVVIVFNIIAAIAIVTNSLHLWLICSQRRLKKARYYNYKLFLIVLAVMDLSLGVVRLILSNDFFQRLMNRHSIFCTVTAVYLYTTLTSMISMIVLVSVDRAYSLNMSVHYQNRKFVIIYPQITAAVICFFAIIHTALGIVFNGRGFSTKDVGGCNFGSSEIPLLAAPIGLIVLVDLLVLIAVYIYIFALTQRHLSNNRNLRENQRVREITQTIGVIIACSALCWIPPILSSVLWAVGIPNVELEVCALILVELNSLANPLLYGLANSTYRSMVYKKLSSCVDTKSESTTADRNVGPQVEISIEVTEKT